MEIGVGCANVVGTTVDNQCPAAAGEINKWKNFFFPPQIFSFLLYQFIFYFVFTTPFVCEF
jgi:hypothetical protein